jgi:hypothetical protein
LKASDFQQAAKVVLHHGADYVCIAVKLIFIATAGWKINDFISLCLQKRLYKVLRYRFTHKKG